MKRESRPGLAFAINRRQLLPALLRELFVVAGAAQGEQALSLADLPDLPADQLAQIVPRVNSEFEITVAEGHLWSHNIRTGRRQQHFALDPANVMIFNQFDGAHSLGEIGHSLAIEMDWEADAAFAYTANLFLSMVRFFVALPADSIV